MEIFLLTCSLLLIRKNEINYYDDHFQARPFFEDRRKFPRLADPMLQGRYPVRGLYQVLAVAAMCLQEQSNMRPNIADVVTALTYLASLNYAHNTQPSPRWTLSLAAVSPFVLIIHAFFLHSWISWTMGGFFLLMVA